MILMGRICLVCKAHYSAKRRHCQFCNYARALPSCRPQHCWLPGVEACKDCFVPWLLSVGLPPEPCEIIAMFLREYDWWLPDAVTEKKTSTSDEWNIVSRDDCLSDWEMLTCETSRSSSDDSANF